MRSTQRSHAVGSCRQEGASSSSSSTLRARLDRRHRQRPRTPGASSVSHRRVRCSTHRRVATLQNDECASAGPRDQRPPLPTARTASALSTSCCTRGDDFINNHLLSMLGAPDFVGVARGAIQDAMDTLGKRSTSSSTRSRSRWRRSRTSREQVCVVSERSDRRRSAERLHQAPDQLLTSARRGDAAVVAPRRCISSSRQHAALDGYLHLPADHHEARHQLSARDDVEFDANTFAAV